MAEKKENGCGCGCIPSTKKDSGTRTREDKKPKK